MWIGHSKLSALYTWGPRAGKYMEIWKWEM